LHGKRILSSIVFVPLLILLILYGGVQGFWLVVSLAVVLGTYEFYHMVERRQLTCYKIPGMVLSWIVSCSFLFQDVLGISFTLTIVSILIVLYALFARHPLSTSIVSVATTFFGIVYVSWLLSHLVLIRGLGESEGKGLIFYLLLVIWAGDTGAFYIGSYLGRHKLAPIVSPKKTLEGAVGGLGASVLASLGIKGWMLPFLSYKHAWILGGLLAVMGQLGDLGESLFKRDANLKDSGTVIPGHGGILDRLDSLLFSAPVLYYYVVGFVL